MKYFYESRREVMKYIEPIMLENMDSFLKPIDENWQPSDLLPDSLSINFLQEIRDIQERARGLSYDLLAVLVGDTITEEALPTYESWLALVEDVSKEESGGWMRWIRHWTAEENRHGDLLNKYLYLSGRVNMRMMEVSTQYLIADGFDIGTGRDPYRNFIYTSFQELATNVSHRRTATIAKLQGDHMLSKICGTIASDESRHAKAYQFFMEQIFNVDPNEALLAFADMMKKKIVMPAHFLREFGEPQGQAFAHFSDVAQRLNVYTALDYVEILSMLLKNWKISDLVGLNDAGEKSRDYLMGLPLRLNRIVENRKMHFGDFKFSWIV
jgi:acyl-[acyl-carrier-protein] desaturase